MKWFIAAAVAVSCVLAALIYTGAVKSGHSNPPADSSLRTVDTAPIYDYELPNGLRLIVQEDHTSPVVSVQAWCKAGSITEGDLLGSGISHILEHMLFKGTETRGNSEIALTVQKLGGYVNAYTSFDRTVFYMDLPSTGWSEALDVLADAMFHSTLPEQEYAKEQEVIRREFAMGFDDPQRVMQKLLFATAFTTHPYKYPVIGHLDVYNKLTRADVLAYYKKNYVPNNITFIVVGDVSAPAVKAQLEKDTAGLIRQPLPDHYIPQEPAQLGRRETHREFPTRASRIALSWHIPGITDPDVYALDVLAILAGQGASSRLYQELVEKKKLVQEISAYSYTPAQAGLWVVSATLQPDSKVTLSDVETQVTAIIDGFKDDLVSPGELAKAKRQTLVGLVSELRTVAGRAGSLGSSLFTANDVRYGDTYLKGVDAVTAADILRVARKYLTPANLTVVSLNPPGTDAKLEQAKAQSSQATPVKLETLGSGVSLVTLHDPKLPLVTFRVVGRGGVLAESAADNGIGQLTFRLLDKGTKKRTAQVIAEEVESLGGSLSCDIGNNSFSISIEVLEQDAEAAMRILSDVVLDPTFPQDEIDKERQKQLADLSLEQDKPLDLARNTLRKNLFGDHAYGLNPLGTPDTLARLSRADIAAYHRRLLQRGNLVFSAAGSIDSDKARSLFERYFPAQSLPEGGPVIEPVKVTFGGKGQEITVNTPKQQAIVEIGYPGVDIADPDRAALDIIDENLSDLASRLFIRIREKQSLAYFVGSQQLVGFDQGYFMFYAGTEASKSQKVVSELLDEIRIFTTEGFKPEEIERARAKLFGQRLLQDQSASIIAYKASLNQLYGLGIDFEQKYNDKVRSLTLDQINDAAKRFFSGKNYVTVVVQPPLPPAPVPATK
jgi:zinc protease